MSLFVDSLASGPAYSDEPEPPHFERAIAPLLVSRCLGCHNASEAQGGLNLASAERALAGGDTGEVLFPGDPDSSWLLERVATGEMPPEGHGEPLSPAEVQSLRQWIEAGAPWPARRTLSSFEFTTATRAGYDWWALQPLQQPPVPSPTELSEKSSAEQIAASAWGAQPIDAFILARLAAAGLSPSPPADRQTLIRRLTLDLWGLPPTPEQVREFVADPRPDAYEQLVDQLLASPRYGERWGRHWLDVVRFGETNGYETNTPRPNAWPYRDYVIESFNNDLPFDQFIREQLAGDQLGADIATGFLVGGTHDEVGNETIEGQLQQRMDDLNDMIHTTTTAFLGLTAGCARCHDHKFDCISQQDYYRLQAVFAGVFHGERQVPGADYQERLRREPEIQQQLAAIESELVGFEPLAQTSQIDELPATRVAVSSHRNIERFAPQRARFVRFTILQANEFEPCLDELEVYTAESQPRNVALASAGAQATASSSYSGNPIHQLDHINDGRYGNRHSWIAGDTTGWVQIELAEPAVIDRIEWGRDREGRFSDRTPITYRIEIAVEPDAWQLVATEADREPYERGRPFARSVTVEQLPPQEAARWQQLHQQRAELTAALPEAGIQRIYAGIFKTPEATRLLRRGNPLDPQQEVAPGGISRLGKELELAADLPEEQRRLALAAWIVDAENPLTARVIVNRLWHYHFGQGLVNTPSDFGFNGGRPSHPELLDWLAMDLIEGGWTLKRMHRQIVLSQTYRQQSSPREVCLQVDAGGRLLWRYPPRRLTAEAVRDSILAVSGALDLTMGGPGYQVFEPNDNYVRVYTPKREFGPAEWRRMVYQFKPRMEQDATFGVFDCPDASGVVDRRNVSTTPLQALNLLNSPFMLQQADLFAERLSRESGEAPAEQIDRAFWLAYGRPPGEDEAELSLALVAEHGLPALCRALLNTNEFLWTP